MNIGIVGSGNIGSVLTRKFRELGHQVRISNSRGPLTLIDFASETGAIASTTEEVIKNSDVIVVAVPEGAIRALSVEFKKHVFADHVVIIDSGSYFHQRDGAIKEIDEGLTDSQWVSEQLGHGVVKVFNNIGFTNLAEKGQPAGHPDRIALPVSGDRADHKKIVLDLVESIGFDALDAGPLSQSWRQQPGGPAFCTDYNLATLPSVLNRAVRSELRIRLDVFISRVYQRDPSAKDIVQWCREECDQSIEQALDAYNLLANK